MDRITIEQINRIEAMLKVLLDTKERDDFGVVADFLEEEVYSQDGTLNHLSKDKLLKNYFDAIESAYGEEDSEEKEPTQSRDEEKKFSMNENSKIESRPFS